MTQGGPKVVFYRTFGIKWFMRTEATPERKAKRTIHRMSIVHTHSLPSYELGKGANKKTWFAGGPEETIWVWGGPNWVYDYRDARPLPMRQTEHKMVETKVKVKSPDGTETEETRIVPMIIAGKPIDPVVIHTAFTNRVIEAFNRVGQKTGMSKGQGALLAVSVLTLLAVIGVAFWTYYFGVNINCFAHTRACP
jgi:hypothetical protein